MQADKFRQPDRAIREPERARITGLSTSSWYTLQAAGLAPRPFPLSAHTVAWSFNELTEWVEGRKAQRANAWQSLGSTAVRVVEKAASSDTTMYARVKKAERS
jgi:predicted DNA-binding transcriptional regulator AlpA